MESIADQGTILDVGNKADQGTTPDVDSQADQDASSDDEEFAWKRPSRRIVTRNKEGDLKVTSPRVLTRSKAHQAGVELKFTKDWAG